MNTKQPKPRMIDGIEDTFTRPDEGNLDDLIPQEFTFRESKGLSFRIDPATGNLIVSTFVATPSMDFPLFSESFYQFCSEHKIGDATMDRAHDAVHRALRQGAVVDILMHALED